MLRQLLYRVVVLLPARPETRQSWIDRFIPNTFGQLGEDAVIDNHLAWLGLPAHAAGRYLDIGAHHPTSGSNTYRFYLRGARGFAVDIGLRKQALWRRVRPGDRFINAAVVPDHCLDRQVSFKVSSGYGAPTDHISGFGISGGASDDPLLTVPALRAGDLATDIMSTSDWGSAPWRVVNVDIEGLDQAVLNDLRLPELCPDVVAVESFLPAHVSDWHKIAWYVSESPVVRYMEFTGYSLQSVCGPTLVFVRKASRQQLP